MNDSFKLNLISNNKCNIFFFVDNTYHNVVSRYTVISELTTTGMGY